LLDGGALADAALAVDGKDLGGADLHVRVQLHLQAALAVGPQRRCLRLDARERGWLWCSACCCLFVHAFEAVFEFFAGTFAGRRAFVHPVPVLALGALPAAGGHLGGGRRVELGQALAHGRVEHEGLVSCW
jgi:hypothetical protein